MLASTQTQSFASTTVSSWCLCFLWSFWGLGQSARGFELFLCCTCREDKRRAEQDSDEERPTKMAKSGGGGGGRRRR